VLLCGQVWAVRVDVHVLDHGGNLVDACSLSALASLMAFRRPDVSVNQAGGQEVVVHDPAVREPVPFTIQHLPLSVTFALFEVQPFVLPYLYAIVAMDLH
jgi:exosome complex RNA-binding protein Rrp42 (RNase PH superfamily)